MEICGQRHAPAVLTQGKKPGTYCIGGWVGPRAGLKGCGKSRQHRDSIPGPSNPGRIAIPATLSRRTNTTALKCCCLTYVLCLQKKPAYIRPWLGFKFYGLQVSLIIDTAYFITIVDYLGKCGVILIIMFVIKTGKDFVRLLDMNIFVETNWQSAGPSGRAVKCVSLQT